MHKDTFLQAKTLAAQSLRACYKNGKILASTKNFSDYWARDTFWAILGSLELNDFKIARSSLENFIKYQRNDGKIPRKIALDYNGLKYLTGKSFLRNSPRAIYSGNLPPFSSMDGNALFIMATAEYLEKTIDNEFLQKNYSKIKKAIDWYETRKKHNFIYEYALGNWMDTIFKQGSVLYTNVIYRQALKKFAYIAKLHGDLEASDKYLLESQTLAKNINEKFWNGKWFDDQLEKHKNFDTAGNVLSVYFEIADQQNAKMIAEKIIELRKNRKLLPTVDPKYPWWKVNPVTYPFGMQDYHNGVSWLWIDLFAVAILALAGFEKEAQEYFSDICQIINNEKAVGETYFSDGSLYKVRLWQSAVPFAWSSGVFLKIFKNFKMNH